MHQPTSALALGWHPPAVHQIHIQFCSRLHQKDAEGVTPSTQGYGCHGRGDANLSPKAKGNGCSSKEESNDMTVSLPAKGGAGVKLNRSWVKTRRTAHVEQTDSETGGPGNCFSHPAVCGAPCQQSSLRVVREPHSRCLGNTGKGVSKG